MILSSFTMLILGIALHHIFYRVNIAASASTDLPVKVQNLRNEENLSVTEMTAATFEHKLDSLVKIINKMDESMQRLQEQTHTWSIFQHHIESWNDGIRILGNKLDLLQRKHEQQQQQLEQLELNIGHVIDEETSIRQEIKHALEMERDVQIVSSSKLNSILRHIQTMQMENSAGTTQTQRKNANVIAPVIGNNIFDKIDQRFNSVLRQMAQQKDLKQLHSLEKRNSKILENIGNLFVQTTDRQEEFIMRLQRSNECCHSLSNELTTFTESSDILLKRIEKLVRNVSDKLNDIEQWHTAAHNNDEEEIDELENVGVTTVHTDSVFSDDENHEIEDDDTDADEGIEEMDTSVYSSFEQTRPDQDSGNEFNETMQEIEIIRPNLTGCHELLLDSSAENHIDGIYKFLTPEINGMERDFNERFCVFPKNNDSRDSVPWTVIQHRGPYRQQENFNRSWLDYRSGFGSLNRDFWFGNEFIHRLVYPEDYELRIELQDFNGTKVWAEYATFRLESEQYNYNMLISGYKGTVADAMKYHNDKDFSTYDRRNDRTVDACCPCAVGYASGWWFDNCAEANLNGIYWDTPFDHNYVGILWELWHGDYSLKATRMMIRPRNIGFDSKSTYSNNDVKSEDP